MAYTRKARDEYQIHVKYGSLYGWEHEITEETFREARERRKEYRENCPGYPVKNVKKSVPLGGAAMNALQQWNAAVRAWRKMMADRPLGPHYIFPEVELPPDLLSVGRYPCPRDYPPAFWTMNRIARGH